MLNFDLVNFVQVVVSLLDGGNPKVTFEHDQDYVIIELKVII